MNKVMRYQIIKPIDSDWKQFGDVLNIIQRDTREIMNKSMQLSWEYQGFSSEYKNIHGNYPKTKDILNYSDLSGFCYDKLKHEYNKMNKGNYTTSIRKATDKWKNDLKDVLRGDKSITSYKKDIPIDLHGNSINIFKEEKDYYINLSLISNEFKKEIERKSGQFCILISVKDNTQKTILERILNGEYKISASQLIRHKNKWFINLSYGFEIVDSGLDKNNIMGIDMGIVYPVYIAFNNNFKRYKIDGGEIESFRIKNEKLRRSMLMQQKYCGNGRLGRGRKNKIKTAESIGNRIENFRKLTNHKYSRYVIDLAVKHNCGTVQMEDLSGISKDNVFLKKWSYYDLQQKIKYKAVEKGIDVVLVEPKYTSQRCSDCGHIDKENRQTQAEFECLKCGFKTNADYNAARNIATKDIEYIIKEQIDDGDVKVKTKKTRNKK